MLDKQIKALLPKEMKDAIEALSILTNVPDQMAVPVVLATANFATQALTDVKCVELSKRPISCNFVVLAASGAMKSGIYDYVLPGILDYQKEQHQQYKQDYMRYKVECDVFKKETAELVKNGGIGALPIEPIRPNGHKFILDGATRNGLINTLDKVPFGGIFSADAATFFNGHSFSDAVRANEMVATLSKFYSGETVERVTGIDDNNITLYNRRFNMLVLTQPDLAQFLSNKQYAAQGFTHRLLITQSPFTMKRLSTGIQTETDALDRSYALLDTFNNKILQLMREIEPLQNIMYQQQYAKFCRLTKNMAAYNTTPQELLLPVMQPDAKGAVSLRDEYNRYVKLQASYQDNSELCSYYGRAFEHVLRLAATLSRFDGLDHISERYAKCAIGLMQWFNAQRGMIDIPNANVKPVIDKAEKFYEWLNKKPNSECTKSEAFGCRVYKDSDTNEREDMIIELMSRGKIEVIEDKSTKKPSVTFRAVQLTKLQLVQ